MKIAPWHSKRRDETVYHNNTKCVAGKRIDPHYLASGMGEQRTLCPHCSEIDEAESILIPALHAQE